MARPTQTTKKVTQGKESGQARPAKSLSYSEASSRLEDILRDIEEGEVDIDRLSVLVNEAAELVTICRDKLQAAKVQVETIAERLEREAPDLSEDEDEEDPEDDD